ncbi:MAG: HAD-IIB family hydrolase [Coriobacteriales bacterium]|nr:HAD-IIB family hydrolase [Coriobacteriales bacterium]
MRIAFFDIDGTLAIGTNVPTSAAAAIARMRASGDKVFICTGRARAYAEKNFGSYADGFVCCNGRLAFSGNQHLYEAPLAADQVADIVARLDALDAGYCFFEEWAAHYGGNPAYRHVAEDVLGLGVLGDGVDPESLRAYNFDVYFADVAQRERIAQALATTCLLNPHGPHPSADMTVLGVDKGDAVRNVAEALGVAIEDTYAFGDGINDLCMLRAAGHGVAMGNAMDEVKAVAEFVTSDIGDDGVARGLAHYGLA